jgi:hypothetical protein
MNPELNNIFGWMFVALAAIFLPGLTKLFAKYFYPASPGFSRRMAAPLIFSALALACFMGISFPALTLVVLLGLAQIIVSRLKRRNARHAASSER